MLLLKLAWRNIFRQRRRTLLTVISMCGGYILCALSYSLLEGSYGQLITAFTQDHTANVQIHAGDYLRKPKPYKILRDYQQITDMLAGDPEVTAYSPRIFAAALAYGETKSHPVMVEGIDPALEQHTSKLKLKMQQGQYLDDKVTTDGYYPALIGKAVAKKLQLQVGEDLVLISQGVDGSIANEVYQVTGITGTLTSYEANRVYLPLMAAQEFLSLYGGIHQIAVNTPNVDTAQSVSIAINEKLNRQTTDNKFPATAHPWQQIEEAFYKSMVADKKGNQVTMGVIIFIIFIGVLNTVVMSVLERTREFGVLKAIGTKPLNISLMVLLETSMIALLSCIIGVLVVSPLLWWFTQVGFSLSTPVDMGGISIQHMRGELSIMVYSVPAMVIIGSAILVSLPPGLRAGAITPIKALGSQ